MMRGQCPRLGQGVGPQGGTDAATTQGRCLWLKLWHERKEASRMEMHSPAAGLGRSGGIGALKAGSKAWGPGLGTGLSGRKLYFNQLAAPTEPGRESVQERKREGQWATWPKPAHQVMKVDVVQMWQPRTMDTYYLPAFTVIWQRGARGRTLSSCWAPVSSAIERAPSFPNVDGAGVDTSCLLAC